MKKTSILFALAIALGTLFFTEQGDAQATTLNIQNVRALENTVENENEPPVQNAGCAPTTQNPCWLTFSNGLTIRGVGQPYYEQ